MKDLLKRFSKYKVEKYSEKNSDLSTRLNAFSQSRCNSSSSSSSSNSNSKQISDSSSYTNSRYDDSSSSSSSSSSRTSLKSRSSNRSRFSRDNESIIRRKSKDRFVSAGRKKIIREKVRKVNHVKKVFIQPVCRTKHEKKTLVYKLPTKRIDECIKNGGVEFIKVRKNHKERKERKKCENHKRYE